MRSNSEGVTVECYMTAAQMFDALCQFCEHITDETFAQWVEQLKDEKANP